MQKYAYHQIYRLYSLLPWYSYYARVSYSSAFVHPSSMYLSEYRTREFNQMHGIDGRAYIFATHSLILGRMCPLLLSLSSNDLSSLISSNQV